MINAEPLQFWADRVVLVPGLIAVRASLSQTGLAGEIVAEAGPQAALDAAAGTRRRAWSRADQVLDRRERALLSDDGRWSGDLILDFASARAEVSGTLLDVLTDSLVNAITAQVLIESCRAHRVELLEQRDAANQVSRAFDLAFEESVLGLALVPLRTADAGRLTRVNDRLRHITGASDRELRARNFTELLHPEDRRPQESAYRRVLAGRRAPFRSEGRLHQTTNGTVWVRVTAAPLLDDMGDPTHLLVQVEELAQRGTPEVQRAERTDPLTGLLTVDAFEEAVTTVQDRARRSQDPAAIYLTRIENWDGLVESLGVEMSHEIQRQVAERLRSALRVDDAIGRLDDREFAFLAEELSIDDAASLARRIEAALSPPLDLNGQPVSVRFVLGASMIGVADSAPADLAARARSALARAASRPGAPEGRFEIDPNGTDVSAPPVAEDDRPAAQIIRYRRR